MQNNMRNFVVLFFTVFEEIDGALVTFCVWVSLITEMLEEAERSLVQKK